MGDHKFQFRLSCRYRSKKNLVANLVFEHLVDNEWVVYDPANYAAGFLILLYAVFNCQHLYFRVNAAERGLQLNSAKGRLEVEANENWEIQKLTIRFDGQLVAGTPKKDDEKFIVERMAWCPVSVNLKAVPDTQVSIGFSRPS
jgi:hypothetical protein